MAEAKTREQIEQEWWDGWWARDFSWAGLANAPIGKNGHTIHGGLHGEQHLQEYWRRDPATGAVRHDAAMQAAGELEECDGILFHIAHLPAKSKAGAATWKVDLKHQNWARLESLITPRLSAIADTRINDGGFDGPDGRTQLTGCVLRGAISHKPGDPLYFNAHGMATLGDADYSSCQFGPLGAKFEGALFVGRVDFNSANFSTGGRFDSAVFSGEVLFESATFSGLARFDNATCSGRASFRRTTFSGLARFVNATFSGRADYAGATFSGSAFFHRATFRGDAGFDEAVFSGVALFDRATFSEAAFFHGATFVGEVSFAGATFSGLAVFHSTIFSGDARFDSATFSSATHFGDAKFKGKAYLQVEAFESAAWFSRAQFDELVWFDDTKFKGDVNFTAAVFDKLASFERISWPADCRHWHSAFDQALFRGTLGLAGSGFRAFAAFDGATLERGVQIDDPETEEAANRTFHAERRAAINSAKRDGVHFKGGKDAIRAQREARLRQLERGCRVLKLAMEYSSNKSREQMLYRFELQARRAQRKLRFGEKLFSDLYAIASDYGASIWRPFAALAVLIAAFGATFWGLAAALDRFTEARLLAGGWDAQLWSALNFSWSNVFKPLSALSSDSGVKDGSMIDLLLTEAGDGWAFGVRALATLQSLLAIVLAFLFALAVRRRFQIS